MLTNYLWMTTITVMDDDHYSYDDKYRREQNAKQCALICVDEIDKAIDFDWMEVQNLDREHDYWDRVREHIKQM